MLTIRDIKNGDIIHNLKLFMSDNYDISTGKFKVMLVNQDENTKLFKTINAQEVLYCMANKEIKNGIMYADFIVMEIRKRLEILCIGSPKYNEIMKKIEMAKITKTSNLNDFEIGRLYVTTKFEDDKTVYMYMGKNFRMEKIQNSYGRIIKVKFEAAPCFAVVSLRGIARMEKFVKSSNVLIGEAPTSCYQKMNEIKNVVNQSLVIYDNYDDWEKDKKTYEANLVLQKLS